MKLFEKKGFDVYGADLIEPENKNKFNIKCSNFESEEIQFDNNKFDIVFSKSVIEHLKNPNNIIKEALRVLKPGGKIILLTPSWLHTYWGPFYIDHTHVSPFTVSSLKNILQLPRNHYFFQWRVQNILGKVEVEDIKFGISSINFLLHLEIISS